MRDIEIVGPGSVQVGRDVTIGQDVRAIFGVPAKIVLGDYVTIGDATKFIVESGDIHIDDWSTLHNDTTVLCKRGVTIGQHCWFGQNSVIDGTGGMTIENGVRVGMYSQLWSHVAAGEQIEGCTLYAETPSRIEEDVWLVGTCFVASGVTVGRRTIALAGSNITKSCPAYSVLAGAPASVKPGLSFYRDVSSDEKAAMLWTWLDQFRSSRGLAREALVDRGGRIELEGGGLGKLIFHRNSDSFDKAISQPVVSTTDCCLENKRYRKAYTRLERDVLKYLSGNKARFYKLNAEMGLEG